MCANYASKAQPPPASTQNVSPQRKKRPIVWRALRWGFLLLAGFHVFCVVILLYLRFLPPLFTVVQLQRKAERILDGNWSGGEMTWKNADEISPQVLYAVVAAEDTRFYEHNGIDFDALEEAMGENRKNVRGGSTLTQQLVKNLFFTTHRSYLRKGLEFTIAPMADFLLSKDRVLELYVNVVEWGDGIYGIEAAAQHHYHKSAQTLSRDQAARLAACLPDPLHRKPQGMNRYSRIIQRRMRAMGH